jgi:hypothetical protein
MATTFVVTTSILHVKPGPKRTKLMHNDPIAGTPLRVIEFKSEENGGFILGTKIVVCQGEEETFVIDGKDVRGFSAEPDPRNDGCWNVKVTYIHHDEEEADSVTPS